MSDVDRPNIVFIMADDMGYGDVGCYNPQSGVPTPHMDRLAAEGMRFTDAHSPSAVCTPTRYGVLTGRYCWRSRLKEGVLGGYDRPLIEPERLTIASMLKARGYHAACIGKWHVGATFHDAEGNPTEKEGEIDFSQPVTGGPTALGFDYAYWNAGCGTCGPPYGFIENEAFVDDSFSLLDIGEDGPLSLGRAGQWGGMEGGSWVTKDADPIIAKKACSYIEGRAEEDEPFFLYLTPNAPHEPCYEQFVPEFARGKSEAGARGDLVWLFDWVVGEVIATLERTGQLENTIIIVTSDNGALPGTFTLDENGNRLDAGTGVREFVYETYGHKSNGDWRGYKAHIWEGGHREPLLVHWPGNVRPGTVSGELVCLTDILATCAEIVGCDLPNDAAEDSVSLLPALTGDGTQQNLREAVVHHSSFGVFSIRQERWKLVLGTKLSGGWPTPRGEHAVEGEPGQLYDVEADPQEESDLWDEQSDRIERLAGLVNQYRESARSVPLRG